ncbi:MAG: helix-turn-helix transcriptional regulator [Desulfovibrio sp.]|nr:helix-turn-helix transcriptional regulator [Desulfovibrio sp.]
MNTSDCPLEYTANLLGGKWKIRLLWAVHMAGTIRFNQLKRELEGITDLALSKCLKDFVASGVMRREQYNEIPPHVEYSLTENGQRLVAALAEVRQWSRGQNRQSLS